MNELHLFAGAGGGILGGHLLGHTCVCAVEWTPYARRVLLQRQRDNVLPRFPIWDDVETFDGKPWKGRVDVVCGGFPCQDISAAGKGAGIDGAKSGMWRHMARIVSEVRPRFVFVENSPMLTSRGLGVVLGDLAAMGYDAEWCVLGAADAGAPHIRERIWILAYAVSKQHKSSTSSKRGAPTIVIPTDATGGRPQRQQNCDRLHGKKAEERASKPIGMGSRVSTAMAYTSSRRRPAHKLRARRDIAWLCSQDVAESRSLGAGSIMGEAGNANGRASRKHVPTLRQAHGADSSNRTDSTSESESLADANSTGCKEQRRSFADGEEHETAKCGDWWRSEPALGRVANGVAYRVDRLTAIGNGQVPAVAALAWRTLMARIESR